MPRPTWKPETLAIHAGEGTDPTTRASTPNLVMSVSFTAERITGFSAHDAADADGFSYARAGSPTVAQLEAKLAALEGGEAALCFASGMAATHALLFGRLSKGDHVVVADTTYVGTAELARETLTRFGVEVTVVDPTAPDEVTAALRPTTRMLWLETPANPTLKLCDVAALASLAKAKGVRDVVVDSTFATPMGMTPLALGADFVVHSLTKYLGGHGDALGGAVVARSKQELSRLRLEASEHFGGVMSPFNAWLILRGVATLPLRMRAHQEGALAVARFLEGHPAVKRVLYPGLPSHPQAELARRQLRNFGGMLTFQTHQPGAALVPRLIAQLEVIHVAVSLGHHRSLLYWIGTDEIQRATYRHAPEHLERYRAFAGDGIFRLSVGLEHPDDLIEDLAAALG